MTFDRLLYIDRLKIAGVDELVARAHAEALRDALADTVATKSDLQELERKIDALAVASKADLNAGMQELRTELQQLDRKIDAVAAASKADLQELERSMKADMQALERSLKADMQELDRKIDSVAAAAKADLDALENRLDRKFDALDRKIELGLREVVIKGAGGLVIVVSVMIGLKLFG